ncbi:GTP binding protein [Clonorchis sinensis]|uniref:GTP binding protein n=1 Tax=Clonorchis sinensis TaxID=79923 RepID=A0A3R7CAB3_CLOSI|nr:GTP binding protein [Clonorchis sinensis]
MDDLARYFSNSEDNFKQSTQNSQRNDRKAGRKLARPASFYLALDSLLVNTGFEYERHFDPHDDTCCGTCWKRAHGLSAPTRGSLDLWSSESCGCVSALMPHQLPPEVEAGNIEYKRKLVNPTPNRFEQLVTQMKWRLNEGGGEAIYRLGVNDDGHVSGLSPKELESSLATLRRMAQRLNAIVQPLRERTVSVSSPPNSCQSSLPASYGSETRKAVELLVRQSPLANNGHPSLCIAVLGGMDAGKSTLIGVLTDGELDNARGRARLNLFRHLHEVQTGRTSSLSSELLGFDIAGNVTNYTRTDGLLTRSSVDELVRNSYQLVTLLDSAGHSKYQRTTLAGLARAQPVGVLLVVSAVTGLTAIGLEHAQLAFTLGLPVAVVVSKIDQIVGVSERNRQVAAVCRQVAIKFNQLRLDTISLVEEERTASTRLKPMFFPVSAVSGEGIDKLIHFLGRLSQSTLPDPSQYVSISGAAPSERDNECKSGKPVNTNELSADSSIKESLYIDCVHQALKSILKAGNSLFMCFWVCEVFTSVPGVPDPVLFGIVRSGQLTNGHMAWLGPDQLGQFHLVEIRSLQHNRQPYSEIFAGQTASVAVHFAVNTRRSLLSGSVRRSLSPTANQSESAGEQVFYMDNSENIPHSTDTVFSFANGNLLPITLRRGMVMLSNSEWSGCLLDGSLSFKDPIPFRIPHVVYENPLVGVAWTVEIDIAYRLSIYPGFNSSSVVLPPLPLLKQRVVLYAGCVAQPAVVTMGAELGASNSKTVRLHVRFTRHPEYLEVGRQIILTWAGCAKAVGSVVGLDDLVPCPINPDPYVCWLDVQAQLRATGETNLMELDQLSTADPIEPHLSEVPQGGDMMEPVDTLQFRFASTDEEPPNVQEPKPALVNRQETASHSPNSCLNYDAAVTCHLETGSSALGQTPSSVIKREESYSGTDKPLASSSTVVTSDREQNLIKNRGTKDTRSTGNLDPAVRQPAHRRRRRRKRT